MGYFALIFEDGTELSLTAAGLTLESWQGAGMPPIDNVIEPYAVVDGAVWQRQVARPRVINLVVSALGATEAGLQILRQKLIRATHPHRAQPVTLRYYGTARALELHCYYDAGLEGGDQGGWSEAVPLKLLAVDPYWRAVTDETGELDVRQVVTVNNIARRASDGIWSNLSGGADNDAVVIFCASDGIVYVGGGFHNIGGIAALHVASYNPVTNTWSALGAGLDDVVWCIAEAPNGDIIIGGSFLNVAGGGIVLNRIGRWNGTIWSAFGVGTNGPVNGIKYAWNGDLYVTGAFATAGGGAALCIAKWNGSVWSAVGAGLNSTGLDLAVGLDGAIYVVGFFTAVAGGGITLNYVGKWDTLTSTWSALGTGLNNATYGIVVGLDGTLYIAGDFTTAGGLPASEVASWNGTAWRAMGAGLSGGAGGVNSLARDLDGKIWAAGRFGQSGSLLLPMRYSYWSDPLWLAGDGNVAGLSTLWVAFGADRSLYMGGDFAGTLSYPGHSTITNPGTANAYPVFTLPGPGRLYHIVNYTTGKRLDFNITLLAGEVATLDLSSLQKTFTSTFRGNIIGSILPSDLMSFALAPGDNDLAVFIDNEFILNPGFETAGGGGADIWANWTESVGDGALANEIVIVHSGSDAAKMTAGPTFNTHAYEDIAVVPGTRLHIQGYAYGNGATAGRFQVYDNTNGADIIATTMTGAIAAARAQFYADFDVPAGCFSIRVYMRCAPVNAAICYFDDIGLWQVGEIAFTPRFWSIDGAAE